MLRGIAGMLALCALGLAHAETFHVRIDGGDATQCTGRSDAPYPGTGTAQACAWSHPFFALAPDGTRRIAGGDTLRIGGGSYRIGLGAPGAGTCLPANCSLATIPSGASGAMTRILGDPSSPAHLWGAAGVTRIVSLDGSSHVELGYLEITDQDDCIYNHSNASVKCAAVGSGNWGKHGVYARASSNVWLHDLDIHGLGHTGLWAGGLVDWTLERVRLNRNGRAGWDANIGTGSSNSGTITLRGMEIGWNGCGERWQTGEAWACWGQQTGGYGDGLGTVTTGGQWLIEDSFVHHNTQDGLDLRFLDGADATHATLRRVLAVGNAGNQVKVKGNSLVENSVLIGTCGFFNGRDYMLAADNCRADGTTLLLVFTPNDLAVVRHNTITGQGWSLVGATEGDSSGRALVQNNMLAGHPWFLNPADLSRVQAGNSPALVTHAGNLVWNVYANACPGDSICGQDPRLANLALAGFDGTPLSDSPVVDRVAPLGAVTTDFLLNPRPRGIASDIGAYEIEPPVTCQRAAPVIALSGSTSAVPAGTTIDYTLTLTSHDSAACETTTYALAQVVPSGWSSSLGASSLTLASGDSGGTTLSVTSPSDALADAYPIGAGTSSSAGAVHTASTGALYTIEAPQACTPAAPTMSLQGGAAAVPAGTPVDYTLALTNNDSSACATTVFGLADTVPVGWSDVLAQSQLSLAPGASGSTTLTVTSPAEADPGGYGIGSGASSPLGATHTASAGATYTVQAPPPPCTRNTPTLGLSGPTAAVAAGTAVDYSVQLANNDTGSCSDTTFTLARSVPAGWSGDFAQTQLTLAPGAGSGTTLTVTSASDATEGSHTLGAAVSSNVGAPHTTSDSATYTVAPPAPPCTRAAPSLLIDGPSAAVAAGTSVDYTVHVTNNDAAACASTSFSLARSVPAGWSGVLGAGTLTLAPGGSDTVALTVTSASNASAGGYVLGVGVGSDADAVHTVSTETTYTVDVPAPTCTRVAPLVSLTGSTTAVPAGTAVVYILAVSNEDSSACTTTSFNLASTVPASWNGTLAAQSLSLAPGANGSTTLTVTSATNATAGPYAVGGSTSSNGGVVHAASASITYTVATPLPQCTRAAPTLSLIGGGAAVAAGTAVDYTVAVTNNDSAACTGTSFSLTRTVPAGWTGALTASSLTLAPGANGNTTLRVTSPASAAAATYDVGVATGSSAGAIHAQSASASYIVAPPVIALQTMLTTDKASYARRATVLIAAQVLNNGTPLPGIVVTFTLARPGGTQTLTATSGSDGFARTSYKVPNTKTAIGSYTVTARWSFSGVAAAPVSVGFTVL